jgi:muramoyltetrapeptide carboxypeptidase
MPQCQLSQWLQIGNTCKQKFRVSFVFDLLFSGLPQPYTITSGKARGRLVGGNLSLVTNILGSLYAPLSNFIGNILFIEDVGEAPVKIDRYLTQLEMFGVLRVVSGIVFGQCTSCTTSSNNSFTIPQVLNHHFAHLGVPVFANAMFGHIDTQFSIPLGVMAEMDANAFTIKLLEPAVQ